MQEQLESLRGELGSAAARERETRGAAAQMQETLQVRVRVCARMYVCAYASVKCGRVCLCACVCVCACCVCACEYAYLCARTRAQVCARVPLMCGERSVPLRCCAAVPKLMNSLGVHGAAAAGAQARDRVQEAQIAKLTGQLRDAESRCDRPLTALHRAAAAAPAPSPLPPRTARDARARERLMYVCVCARACVCVISTAEFPPECVCPHTQQACRRVRRVLAV